MKKQHRSGKLAVILHTDIAGSTRLVDQVEQLAHQRIQDKRNTLALRKLMHHHERMQNLNPMSQTIP